MSLSLRMNVVAVPAAAITQRSRPDEPHPNHGSLQLHLSAALLPGHAPLHGSPTMRMMCLSSTKVDMNGCFTGIWFNRH